MTSHAKRMNLSRFLAPHLGRRVAPYLLPALLSACGAEPEVTPAAGEVSSHADKLYIYPGVHLFTENDRTVPMCWITPGYAREKGIFRSAIENTWIREANLRISWADCASVGSQPAIRIYIGPAADDTEVGAATVSYGTATLSTDSASPSMWVGFRPDGRSDAGRVRHLAVHEFGHVLGFAHEQDQPGAASIACRTRLCQADTGASSGPAFDQCMRGAASHEDGRVDGPYDPSSVMNYCGPEVGKLSALDVEAVRRVYGRKHDGAIVGIGGKCLDVWGDVWTNGTPIRMYDCHGARNDTFAFRGLGTAADSDLYANGKCVDVQNPAMGRGAPTVVGTCGTAATRFQLSGPTAIRGFGGKCLTRAGGIVMNECDGSAAQQWLLGADQTLYAQAGATRSCLSVRTSDNRAILATCNGTSLQKWSILRGGHLVNQGRAMALDVWGANPANGAPVGVYPLVPTAPNHKWSLRTKVKGYGGRVLDVAHAATDNGAVVSLWDDVPGAPNEVFDLYP